MIQASSQLAAKGVLTTVEHERRQQEGLQLELNLSSLNDQLLARQSQMSETHFMLDQLPIVTADRIRVLRNELADVEQRISEVEGRRAYRLRSPINGHVSMLQLTPGQSVDPRQLQIAVIPTGSVLQAEVFVPSRAVGFVRIGQPVQISYDSFPYQRYGTYKGHITKLSDTVLSPSDITAPVSVDQSAYRAVVTLDHTNIEADGQKIEIRPDMVLRADIILEKRSIVSWILNPLYGTQKAIDLTPLRTALQGLAAHPTLVSFLNSVWTFLQESWVRATKFAVGSWDSFQKVFSQRTSPESTKQRTAGHS
jgi:membrane fusion protein